MAHHQVRFQAAAGQIARLIQADAGAVHAGIDVQDDRPARPGPCLFKGVEHRRQVRIAQPLVRAGQGAVQHQDRRLAPAQFLAKGLALGQPGDKEGARALRP